MVKVKEQIYADEVLGRPGIIFPVEIEDPKERVQAYLDEYKPKMEGFDEALMADHLSLVSATAKPTATTVFEMAVTAAFTNRMGNMHGGAIALVYDMCTTMAAAPVARKDFWWFGGVSRTLNVTFMRPVKLGMRIVIESEVLQIGSRLATIRGVMKDKATGSMLSVAEHNKVSIVFVSKASL